jgi:hypothetical protein
MAENEQPGTQSETRRPYEPPSLHRVLLRPQEAVLGFCKNSNSSGPGGGGCQTAGLPCSGSGS